MVRNSLDEPPSFYALAIGNKNGQTASCGTTFRASDLISMGEATGIPLACGLKLLIDGKITKFGVFAPEGVIDPNDFFKELYEISDLFEKSEEVGSEGLKLINIFRSWL
jgi:Saccharopine dehydrogenase and related proteins